MSDSDHRTILFIIAFFAINLLVGLILFSLDMYKSQRMYKSKFIVSTIISIVINAVLIGIFIFTFPYVDIQGLFIFLDSIKLAIYNIVFASIFYIFGRTLKNQFLWEFVAINFALASGTIVIAIIPALIVKAYFMPHY